MSAFGKEPSQASLSHRTPGTALRAWIRFDRGLFARVAKNPIQRLRFRGITYRAFTGLKHASYHFLERCIHSMILTQLGAARLAGAVREMDPTAFD